MPVPRRPFAVLALLTTLSLRAVAEDPAPPPEKPAAKPDDLERQLQKALQSDQATESKAAAQSEPSPPAPSGGGGAGQSFNPDLSFIADFALAGFFNARPLEIPTFQPGGHDPQQNGVN